MKQIVFLLVLLIVIFLLIAGCTTTPSFPLSGPSGSPTGPGTSPSPSPDSVKWHEQGFDLISAGQNQEAILEFDKAILSNPNNVDAWNGKGNALFNLGKNDDAMTAFDKAIAIDANYYPAYIGRGNVFFALRKYEEAIKAFDKALLIDPNNKWAQEGKERVLSPTGAAQTNDELTLNNKGFALIKMERNEAALKEFESAIAINPNNSWAWQGKGEAVKNLGNTSESLRYFETAISTNPNNQWGWHGKGDALFRLGNNIEAITYFDTALSINKNNQWAWQGKGLALASLGRDQEAVDAFSRSLAIHENNPDTWAVEGQTLMHLGKCSEAKKAFEKSLSFDSNNRIAQEGLMNAGDSYYCHSQPSGSIAGNAPLAVTSPSLHQETPYPSTQQTTVPTSSVTLNSISSQIQPDVSQTTTASVNSSKAGTTPSVPITISPADQVPKTNSGDSGSYFAVIIVLIMIICVGGIYSLHIIRNKNSGDVSYPEQKPLTESTSSSTTTDNTIKFRPSSFENESTHHDIFISYSSEDKPIADAICNHLESRHIRCWVAPRDILPGINYQEAIIDAIDSSSIMVLVFSSHSNESPHVLTEVNEAMSNGVIIIPFRIENILPSKAMKYLISGPHWLDAMTPPLEKHIQELEETVRILIERKQQKSK